MACVARGRPRGGLVIGVARVVVVRHVTSGTHSRQRDVVVVHVATGAGHGDMGAGKRKRRVVMVKRTLAPRQGVVTHLAGRRKTQLNVIHRRQGVVVVGLVTGHTSCVGQAVVVVDVAGSAAHGDMGAGQSPAGRGMIERRGCPRGS